MPDLPLRDPDLLAKHGHLARGSGIVTGVMALSLSVLSLLAVLAFRFPSYLSTPELRATYDVTTLRYILFAAMLIAGALAIRNIIFGLSRTLNTAAFAWLVLAELLGGPAVPVGKIVAHSPYIGVDFFVLDLLGSALLFIVIEKLRPLRPDQPVFRAEWQNDLNHFFVNHMVLGFILLLTNRAIHATGLFASHKVAVWLAQAPLVVSVFLIFLSADMVQYWAHRAYHEVPFLWRFHAVHHSTKSMDWLAGSRQHLFELIGTRIAVITPIFFFGFPKDVIDLYIIVVGFQAVFDHANVSAGLGPLKYVFVTPNFHHWHHARDDEAIDKNYAAHYAFLDYLFGTAAKADRPWPDRYGVVGDYIPLGFVAQQAFPFVGSTASLESQQGDYHTAAGRAAKRATD